MTDTEISEELKSQIDSEAYSLAEKNLSYDELCWILTEESIKSERDIPGRISKLKIEEKAKAIFNLSYSEDELCWRIAELIVRMNK